jgi:Predicted Co/Zn/Cd cation transporters
LDIRAGVAVTLLAMLITAAPLVSIIRTARRGAAVRAQLVALVEMELAFFLALVALVLTANGYAVANPLSSLAIGILILVSGLYLLKDNADYLIGKAPPISFLEEIRTTARSVPGVLGVHDLKAEYVGPGIIHSGFHITIAANISIEKADPDLPEEGERKPGGRKDRM